MARMPTTLPTTQRSSPRSDGVRMPEQIDRSGERELAQTLDAIAEAEIERDLRIRRQNAEVTRVQRLSELRARQTERLVKDGDALTEDQIDGFADRYAEAFDPDAEETIGALPKVVQAQARAEAAEMRESLRLRAVDVEHGRRIERNTRALDEQLEAAGNTVYTDPTQYAATTAASRAAIEASGLPEGLQQRRLAALDGFLASQRLIGLARSAPDDALTELAGESWKGVLSAEQHADLVDMARRQRDVLKAEALATLDPVIDGALNAILSNPASYQSEIAAFASRGELAALDEGTRKRVLRDVASRGVEARVLGLIRTNPYRARQELLSRAHDDVIEPSDKARLIAMSDNEIEHLEARRRAAAADAERVNRDRLEQLMKDDLESRLQTGQPVPVSLAEVERVFGVNQAQEYARARDEALDNFRVIDALRWETPQEIERSLARLRPRAGQAGYEAARRRYSAIGEIATELLKARRDDPVASALASDPVLTQLYEDLTTNVGRTDAARRNALAALNQRQASLGVAAGRRRLLTNNMARELAGRIAGAAPAGRARAMEQVTGEMSAMFGADAGRALAEIGAVGEMPEVAALAPLQGNPMGQRRVASALGNPEPQIRSGQTRAIERVVDEQLRSLRRSLADTPGGAERLAEVRAAAVRTAMDGVANGGQSPDNAARAAARLYTEQFQFRDGWRLPRAWNGRQLDASRIAHGAAVIKMEIARDDQFTLPAGDPRVVGEEARRAASESFRASTRWITTADDRGLMLVDEFGSAVADRSGQPIRRDWDALLDASRRPTPKAAPDIFDIMRGEDVPPTERRT